VRQTGVLAEQGDFADNHFVDAPARSGFIRQVGAADYSRCLMG